MTLSPARAARRDTWLLLALLLLYFLLMIGARPLNIPDEGRYPEVAREMLLSGDFVTPRNNGVVFLDKPALYYWLQAGAMALFGVSTWSIRLVPALFGALGVLATFLTVRRLYTRRAAWLSALALACQPLWFLSSQYADMNMQVGVWITFSLLAFLRADHATGRERGRWLLLMYLCAGAAVLTKGLIGVVFPLMIIGGWIAWRRRWRDVSRYGLAWGLPLILLVNLPWYALVQKANPGFLHYFFVYQQLDRYAASGFNNAQPWWYYLAIIGGGLLPWSPLLPGALARLWRRWREEGETGRRHLLLLLWPALILLFFSLPESKISSYLLPAIPPLAMAIGIHLDARLREPGPVTGLRPATWCAVAAGTAFLVGTLYWKGSDSGRLLAIVLGLQWLLAGTLARLQLARAQALAATRTLAATTALGLLLCIPLVPEFTQYSSSAPLAARMQPALTDDTRIISYRNYLNDLPLYLQPNQRVIVVDHWDDPRLMDRDNWRREFYLGLQEDARARGWLRLKTELPALLADPTPFFLIVRRAELAEVQQRYPGLQLWGQFDRVLLFSNQAPPETRTATALPATPR
ncbi:MAG: glycosyltransferase family 39 protein [Pseudomonadota bacterium]